MGTSFIEGRTAAAYGLIAAAHLAQNDGWIPAKVVAAAYGLPAPSMSNAMSDLARADFVLMGDEYLNVTISHSWGFLFDSSFYLC